MHFIFLGDCKRWDDDALRNICFIPTNNTNPHTLIIHVVFLNPWIYGKKMVVLQMGFLNGQVSSQGLPDTTTVPHHPTEAEEALAGCPELRVEM